jgi:hypothetical protein
MFILRVLLAMMAGSFNIPLNFEKSATFEANPYTKKTLFESHELVCDSFMTIFYANDFRGEKIRRYWMEDRKFSFDVVRENGLGFVRNDARERMK